MDAIINTPNGEILTLPCFYKTGPSKKSEWEARFTAMQPGTHTYHIQTISRQDTSISKTYQVEVKQSNKDGFLRVNPRSKYSFVFDSGKRFRGVGMNLGWEMQSEWRYPYGTYFKVEKIQVPKFSSKQNNIPQDEEWCEVCVDGKNKRIRLHDYDGKIYEIPGLYEKLFYDKLKCCSPSVVVNLLEDVASDFGEDTDEFKVLDVGAGNGMVGDELDNIGIDSVVGIDILPEAKEATFRDRPEIYEDYLVTNLSDMPKKLEIKLEEENFNCLTTVAALGFGDISPQAF